MSSFQEWFALSPAFGVAICHEHGVAMTAKSVASHVKLYHGHVATRARQRIVEEAAALLDKGMLAADIDGIRFPDHDGGPIPAIEGLPVWSDGKRCLRCGHIRRSVRDIQQHCRTEHGWVNPRARRGRPGARPPGGLGDVWVDGVYCQRLGQTGTLQRLFEVIAPAAAPGDGHNQGEGGGSQAAIKATFEASARAIQEKDKAAAALVGEQSRLSANMWVRRTGWARHLRGFDREWLATTIQRPATTITPGEEEEEEEDEEEEEEEEWDDKDKEEERAQSEAELATVWLAIERVIWRAQRASSTEVVGSAAVHYIERHETGGKSNEKPFNAGQKATTMAKYGAVWKSLVAYVWRTWQLEPVEERGAGGGDGEATNNDDDDDDDG
ncbi:hypothetical protein P885DRAFT_5482, partial [Corynascus similis CBS 632.67]